MPAFTKDLTLYHFAGASSFATNIVLNWTGQSANVHKPAETAKNLSGSYADQVNPAALVPSIFLPTNGNILTENIAVLHYIAKTGGHQDLVGGDNLWEQSQVLKWSSFFSSNVHSSFWLVFFTDRFTTNDDPAALAHVKEAGLQRVHEKVTILDNHMKGHQWLVGERKTFSDAHLYVFIRWMTLFMTLTMEDLPSHKSFGERMTEDEGVKDALQYKDGAIWSLSK
jgi:glutathione S-transferase